MKNLLFSLILTVFQIMPGETQQCFVKERFSLFFKVGDYNYPGDHDDLNSTLHFEALFEGFQTIS